jgi:hypothetical protein
VARHLRMCKISWRFHLEVSTLRAGPRMAKSSPTSAAGCVQIDTRSIVCTRYVLLTPESSWPCHSLYCTLNSQSYVRGTNCPPCPLRHTIYGVRLSRHVVAENRKFISAAIHTPAVSIWRSKRQVPLSPGDPPPPFTLQIKGPVKRYIRSTSHSGNRPVFIDCRLSNSKVKQVACKKFCLDPNQQIA